MRAKNVICTFIIVAVVGGFFAWKAHPLKNEILFDGFVGAALGSLVAFLLLSFTAGQLNIMSSNSSMDLVHRLKTDFFSPETRVLIALIEDKFIEFINNGESDSYFLVRSQEIENSLLHQTIKERLTSQQAFSTYEIDDLVLGHIEDMGYLNHRGMLDFRLIYNTFGHYVEQVYDSPAIQRYLQASRKEWSGGDNDTYSELEFISQKCKTYHQAKTCRCPFGLWAWYIRYYLKRAG